MAAPSCFFRDNFFFFLNQLGPFGERDFIERKLYRLIDMAVESVVSSGRADWLNAACQSELGDTLIKTKMFSCHSKQELD